MELTFAITVFFTLFVVIDPIGLAPMFVAMTSGMERAQRLRIAATSCIVAICILTAFAIAGQRLLDFVGISLAAFRISGGILLFITALDMLFERRTARREEKADDVVNDPSVFPLAMPLIAGPGALASVILMASGAGWDVTATVIVVMIGVVAIVFALFMMSGLIERILGNTGIVVATRLMGMILAALSVQFVLDGLADLGLLVSS